MFRFISVRQRKKRFQKDETQTLALFHKYTETIQNLPPHQSQNKKLLLIRLDDIGDYLLFRNTLRAYKQSAHWQGFTITLLGNSVWKELFTCLDKGTTDDAIWIDKKEYLRSDDYKQNLWLQLRLAGFEVVICPSATRPILLDDLCRLATGAKVAYAFANFTPHKAWQAPSNALYNHLFTPPAITHEFTLNKQFAYWCCGVTINLNLPFICTGGEAKIGNYIVCFIGASIRSKRWTQKRWIQLIRLLKQEWTIPVKVIGVGDDKQPAIQIAGTTASESITDTTLQDVMTILQGARVVVTNDTMTSHLAVSIGVPVVIVANGGNVFMRFTNYAEAGARTVKTVYPKRFSRLREKYGDAALQNHIAATSDIAAIKAEPVFRAVKELIS